MLRIGLLYVKSLDHVDSIIYILYTLRNGLPEKFEIFKKNTFNCFVGKVVQKCFNSSKNLMKRNV